MSDLPGGYVDPRDTVLVASVLQAVVDQDGPSGVLELLARLPGVRVDPGAPKGFLRAAVPAATWVGPEHRLVLVDDAGGARLEDHHVVGGVTLAHESLPRDRVAGAVARMIATAVASAGAADDAAAALTAYREIYGPLPEL